MSVVKAPEPGALVTLEKEEGQKQWKAFIFLSPNLLQLYVRVHARVGGGTGAGERIAGAMAGRSMVAFFLFCGDALAHTHTRSYTRGFPPGVIHTIATLSHQCPKTGERSVKEKVYLMSLKHSVVGGVNSAQSCVLS